MFNHIAPVYETRLAKLSRVRPKMTVRPFSDEDKDVNSAKLAKEDFGKLLEKAFGQRASRRQQLVERGLRNRCFYKNFMGQRKGRPNQKRRQGLHLRGRFGERSSCPLKFIPTAACVRRPRRMQEHNSRKGIFFGGGQRNLGAWTSPERSLRYFRLTRGASMGGRVQQDRCQCDRAGQKGRRAGD